MSWEFFVGLRHLMSMRRDFLSTLTVLAIVGVAISVCAYTAVVSVAGGFVDSFRDSVLGVNPHVVVTKFGVYFSEYELVEDAIHEIEGVESTSPFILHEMLVTREGARARPGALVKGVDIDELLANEQLLPLVSDGDLDDLHYEAPFVRSGEPDQLVSVALGRILAERVDAEVGDVITLLSPLRGLRAIGIDGGREATVHAQFRVAAIVDSGFYDYDNRLVIVDYRALQDLFERGDVVTGIDVRIDDVFAAEEVTAAIEDRLSAGRYRALDWRSINRNLFTSLQLQKLALRVVMSVLLCVSSLVIVCVLVMLVIEKRREIAILRSMGATSGSILRIFVIEGMTIGTIGTAIGLLMGWLTTGLLQRIDFGLEFEVYRIDTLPVSVDPLEFAMGGVGALLICFLATLYPSARAAKVTPLDALRYD